MLYSFFPVAILNSDKNELSVYGDDETPVIYQGEFNVDSIVKFVLENANVVIEARSKVAN